MREERMRQAVTAPAKKKKTKKQSTQVAAGYKRDRTIRLNEVAKIADELEGLVKRLRKVSKVENQ